MPSMRLFKVFGVRGLSAGNVGALADTTAPVHGSIAPRGISVPSRINSETTLSYDAANYPRILVTLYNGRMRGKFEYTDMEPHNTPRPSSHAQNAGGVSRHGSLRLRYSAEWRHRGFSI